MPTRAWLWPGVGLGILAAGMALFAPRALERHDSYDPGYALVAFTVALVPTMVAAVLLLALGGRRSRRAADDALTIACLVALAVAVPGALIGTIMFGVS
jgi:hypothetical protein